MLLPFGTWSATSSFTFGGLVGWGAFVFVWAGYGFAATALLPAFGVALLVGGVTGIVVHVANNFKAGTMSALDGQPPKTNKTAKAPRSGKGVTGMVAASYVALSIITANNVATQAGPEAYQSGYEAGISEIHGIENSENSQQGNNIQVATPTEKPTKTPTSRPNPTETTAPQLNYPTLYADKNYLCREGPGKEYAHIVDIYQGKTYRIIGVASNGWYAIAIASSQTSHTSCWIGGGIASGDLSTVKYYELPSRSNGTVAIYGPRDGKNNSSFYGYASCEQVYYNTDACGDTGCRTWISYDGSNTNGDYFTYYLNDFKNQCSGWPSPD